MGKVRQVIYFPGSPTACHGQVDRSPLPRATGSFRQTAFLTHSACSGSRNFSALLAPSGLVPGRAPCSVAAGSSTLKGSSIAELSPKDCWEIHWLSFYHISSSILEALFQISFVFTKPQASAPRGFDIDCNLGQYRKLRQCGRASLY